MYTREWKCICPKETEKGFLEYLQKTGVQDTQIIDGCGGYQILRRDIDEGIEVTFITTWESLHSMKKYAGDNLYKAVLYPEDEQYRIKSDTVVKVYEILE